MGTSLDARVTYFMLQCPTGASVVAFALWRHTISLCVIDLLKYCVCDIVLRCNSVDAGSCQRRPDCHLFRAGSVAMEQTPAPLLGRWKGFDRASAATNSPRQPKRSATEQPICGVKSSLTEVIGTNSLR